MSYFSSFDREIGYDGTTINGGRYTRTYALCYELIAYLAYPIIRFIVGIIILLILIGVELS